MTELFLLVSLWLLIEIVGPWTLALFFSLLGAFDSDQRLTSVLILLFALFGAVFGAASTLLVSPRVLPAGPFPGVSVVLTPLVLAGLMASVGWYRSRAGKGYSHLATWYGGLSLGLGLAIGRLVLLRFIADVRAIPEDATLF